MNEETLDSPLIYSLYRAKSIAVDRKYTVDNNNIIRNAGQFEGEHVAVLYFYYDVFLEGDLGEPTYDDEGSDVDCMCELTSCKYALDPVESVALYGANNAVLHFTPNGFVCLRLEYKKGAKPCQL